MLEIIQYIAKGNGKYLNETLKGNVAKIIRECNKVFSQR